MAKVELGDEARKSEARYRTVLDVAFDAIVIMRPEGIVRWFYRGAERIFGYSSKEVIGQPVTLLMPERYRELCVAGLHRYLRTGKRVVCGTTELVGCEKTVASSRSRCPSAKPMRLGAVVHGCDPRCRRAQGGRERSPKSGERIRTLLQNPSDIITLLEADGTVRYVSPAVERVTGPKSR
jgi:PAS domain S-box-containing protein